MEKRIWNNLGCMKPNKKDRAIVGCFQKRARKLHWLWQGLEPSWARCSLLLPGKGSMDLAKERKMWRNRFLFLANCHYISCGNVESIFHLTYHSSLQTYETIRSKAMPRMQRKKQLSHFSEHQRAAPLACAMLQRSTSLGLKEITRWDQKKASLR